MKVEFDSTEKPETLRAVAAFALMLAGDIDIPSARDEITHHITPDAQAPREMIVPPAGNVLPFPPAPPVPSTWDRVTAFHAPTEPSQATPFASAPNAALNGAPAETTFVPSAASAASATPATPWRAPGVVPPTGIPLPPLPSSAATVTPSPQVASATTAAAVAPAASVEYDSTGLPWDARIHNKGRTKKRDGTWKLQKGLDPIVAQTVVAELAAKRVSVPAAIPMPPQAATLPTNQQPVLQSMQSAFGVMPPLPPTGGPLQPDPMAEARAAFGAPPAGQQYPLGMPGPNTVPASSYSNVGAAPGYSGVSSIPAPQVPLPPAMPYQYPVAGAPAGTLPMPPFPGSSGPAMVYPPTAAALVPPTPQPGTVGGVSPALQPQQGPVSPYKALIDKLTAATQNKTLNPALVAPTVQQFGVPNMGLLGNPEYAGLLPAINQEFDRLIAGGAPSGP